MKNEEHETRFLKQVRAELDREAENLDPGTAAELRRIRFLALEQMESSLIKMWRFFRIPAAVVATGVIITVLATTVFRPPAILQDQQALADLEILASEEQLNLFDEMEFYSWLAETENHAS